MLLLEAGIIKKNHLQYAGNIYTKMGIFERGGQKFSIIFSSLLNIEKNIEYIESLPYDEIDMIRRRNLETQLKELYD